MCHPVCSVSATPSKARLIGFCNKWRTPVHCHREKHQGFTSLYSAVSHSVNEVGQLVFKRKLARWLYRTQADACRSRAIEWFEQLAHRCWPPLPTNRISCDAGCDDLFGKCAIRFAPCLQHQAIPADWLWQQVEEFSPLTQREAAGFHFVRLSCFSQCQ